jgi:PmbA protein
MRTSQFDVTEVFALWKQADAAELYEIQRHQVPVHFRAGALASARVVETTGRALRVIKDGRLGFSTTTDMAGSETLVQRALDSAQFGGPAAFGFPAQQISAPVQRFDAAIERLTEEQLITMGEEIVTRIRSFDPLLEVNVSLSKAVEKIRLFNTSGLEVRDIQTAFSIHVAAIRAQEGDILRINDSATSRCYQDVDGLALADNIIERFGWAESIAWARSPSMPVVFYKQGVLPLLLPLMKGFDGRMVLQQASPLLHKLGERAFDERLTLIDDGLLSYGMRSASYDDEGTPATTKPLIQQGVVQRFLYDLQTAVQAETQPTGNGFRAGRFLGHDFRQRPTTGTSTWRIPSGNESLERILRNLREGLLVEQVMGTGGGNLLSGDFSNTISMGYLVRRGKIIGRVKDTMVAGNVYELLRNRLIALSDQPQWLLGILQTPAIAVDGVGVASRG